MTHSTNQGPDGFVPEVTSFLIGYHCEGLDFTPLPGQPDESTPAESVSTDSLTELAEALSSDELTLTESQPGPSFSFIDVMKAEKRRITSELTGELPIFQVD